MKLFGFFRRASVTRGRASLYFHNTLSGNTEEFTLPPHVHTVRMYNCGPTVYGRQHIGNLSMFVFTDILRRTLEYNGFKVKQVINITDVGHLTSDEDEGEDKMTKGLRAEGKDLTLANMSELGKKYAEFFIEDLQKLNIDTGGIEFPYASDNISADIALIKTLEEKGYAYRGKHGVYYDTSRFRAYGELGHIDIEGLRAGARVAESAEKRHPTDFLLWKLDKKLGWDSPWGKGFPGWHIECSAMINATLGKQIDIHTGGIEHIPVHHNNEIAQSEAALGKHPLSRFWLHRAHVQIEGSKIAKSEGNVVYLTDIIEKGFHPLALRYLFLGAHYRSPSNFSWEALEGAQRALAKLVAKRVVLKDASAAPKAWSEAFRKRVNDDLDTPGALALIWEALKNDSYSDAEIVGIFREADQVLGIGIGDPDADLKKIAAMEFRQPLRVDEIPGEIHKLLSERDAARTKRDFVRADELRSMIDSLGFEIEDAPDGTRVLKK